jgi:hypothetical protein
MSLLVSGFTGPIASLYIPTLNKASGSVGVKVLALSHTIMEGFFPGSKAYRTNNPGNIGTSLEMGTTGIYKTLADGVNAQIKYLTTIIDGGTWLKVNKYYPKKGDTTLKEYIYTYAPPGKKDNNNPEAYINSFISSFQKQGFTITRDTTLNQIAALGDDGKKKALNGLADFFSSAGSHFSFFLLGK